MSFNTEAKYYDAFHKDKNYKKEAKEIRKKFPKAKTILEVGCGTGNLTCELEKLGFKVTCVEPSKEMLKFFKGKTKNVIVKKINEPWFFEWNKEFDVSLAMYDVLNYLPTLDCIDVMNKMLKISKDCVFELWSYGPVKPFTYKRAGNLHRIRLGFTYNHKTHLWYFFFGDGFLVEKHTLYLHT